MTPTPGTLRIDAVTLRALATAPWVDGWTRAEIEKHAAEWDKCERARQRAECPDIATAHALAVLIMTNKVPSPWRDAGIRLKAIGKWLAALAPDAPLNAEPKPEVPGGLA